MKMPKSIAAATLAAVVVLAGVALAQDIAVNSLRGAEVGDQLGAASNSHQEEKRFVRNYRLQPPLVPHAIDQYQIDRNANQCLACHDWSNAGDRGAPTLSMTHYQDREGNHLDAVAGTRWFCNQCHVPQADTPPLVNNTFEPSH
ncbi:nitrate reductase cytochrome c-type subunit [Thalassobius sp. MITS945101]|uniref:nitrate reductase cytochrome c-type subunit n=1 Tax=Thalassobius sp. MITS945101 TaxID=3096994 RepID=UPI00399A8C2F